MDTFHKKTRILTVIYPSNYPNFASDSIFTFNRILFGALLKSNEKVEVIAVGSPKMPQLHPSIKTIPLELGISKFQVRFDFPWSEIRYLLNDIRPDICLINMPEQSAAFALLIKEELNLPCKLISYVHYIPALPATKISDSDTSQRITYETSMNKTGLCKVLLTRLLEGVIASDLTLTCSGFAARLIQQVKSNLLHKSLDIAPIQILSPPVDFNEVNKGYTQNVHQSLQFIYNHRLYDDYGTKHIFNLLKDVYEMDISPFTVILTNPTEGRDPERSLLNPAVDRNLATLKSLPFVKVQHSENRNHYIHTLRKSSGGIAPIKPHALWSMSVMDLLACGRPVLSFNIAAFSNMGLPKNLLVENDIDFKSAFISLFFNGDLDEKQEDYRRIAEQFNGSSTAHRFMKLVNKL